MNNEKTIDEDLDGSAAIETEDPQATTNNLDTRLDNLISTVKSMTEPNKTARADNNLTVLQEKIATLEEMIAKMVSSGAYNPARVSPEEVKSEQENTSSDFPSDIQVFDNIRDMLIDNNKRKE